MIVAKNDKASGFLKIIEEDVIIYFLKNAVFKDHHEFNRGSVYNLFVKFLGDKWNIKLTNIAEKFIFHPGLTTNVFKCEFKYRKKAENLKDNHIMIRTKAKDNFLKAVITSSENA